jgi:hypothetical protein
LEFGVRFEAIGSVGDDPDIVGGIALGVIEAVDGGGVIDLVSPATNFQLDSQDGAMGGAGDVFLGDGEGDALGFRTDASCTEHSIEVVGDVVLLGTEDHTGLAPGLVVVVEVMVGVLLCVTADAGSSLPDHWGIEFSFQAVVDRLFFPALLAGRFVGTVEV